MTSAAPPPEQPVRCGVCGTIAAAGESALWMREYGSRSGAAASGGDSAYGAGPSGAGPSGTGWGGAGWGGAGWGSAGWGGAGWGSAGRGAERLVCPSCARRHLRSIEAKLPEGYW